MPAVPLLASTPDASRALAVVPLSVVHEADESHCSHSGGGVVVGGAQLTSYSPPWRLTDPFLFPGLDKSAWVI